MHQLQRGLRVSCWVDDRVTCWCKLSTRQIQRRRRGVVQQLQRGVRVPLWLDDRDACGRHLCCRSLLPLWRIDLHEL